MALVALRICQEMPQAVAAVSAEMGNELFTYFRKAVGDWNKCGTWEQYPEKDMGEKRDALRKMLSVSLNIVISARSSISAIREIFIPETLSAFHFEQKWRCTNPVCIVGKSEFTKQWKTSCFVPIATWLRGSNTQAVVSRLVISTKLQR
jgi:hypothetical protein